MKFGGHWRVGRRPQGKSSPEKDFCILEANGLSGNWGKSGGIVRVQAEGGGVGWKVRSQGVPKILKVGASLHPRGRKAPGMREGLVRQAFPVVDICRVRVHQHPRHPILGSIHSLQKAEEAVFREGREGGTSCSSSSFPHCGSQDRSVFSPAR